MAPWPAGRIGNPSYNAAAVRRVARVRFVLSPCALWLRIRVCRRSFARLMTLGGEASMDFRRWFFAASAIGVLLTVAAWRVAADGPVKPDVEPAIKLLADADALAG